MTRQWKWLALWIVASVICTVMLVTFFGSKSFQDCIDASQQNNPADTLTEKQSVFPVQIFISCTATALEENNAAINSIATILIAVFTCTLWYATRGMLRVSAAQSIEMKQSIAQSSRAASAMEEVAQHFAENVDTVRERSAKQMRAYISAVVFDGVYQDRNKGLRFEAKPMILNTGHTPAHKVGYKARAEILPVPFPDNFTFPLPDAIVGAASLGPNQSFVMNAVIENYIDDADVFAVKSGIEKALYIWGIIMYEDIFGEEQYTQFCHLITWLPNGKTSGRYVTDYNQAT